MKKLCDDRQRAICPNGKPITLDNLPPADTERWVISRKAIVLRAVLGGIISLEDAKRLYSLSLEELLSWRKAVDKYCTTR